MLRQRSQDGVDREELVPLSTTVVGESDQDDVGVNDDDSQANDDVYVARQSGNMPKKQSFNQKEQSLSLRFLISILMCFLLVATIKLVRVENNNNKQREKDAALSPTIKSKQPQKDADAMGMQAQAIFRKELNISLEGQQDHLCYDDDDPTFFRQLDCKCTNPFVAAPRPTKMKGQIYEQWRIYHQYLVQHAKSDLPDDGIDVLFMGDSITERRTGTKALGKAKLPNKYLKVTRQYFDKSKGASLQGFFLGAGGDTSYELLWHLQHDMLPDALQPRSILILIGTNDLGRVNCSKRNVLAGILNLANYVHKQRPDALMFLHGIIPLADGYRDGNFSTGWKYQRTLWLNRELKRYCELYPEKWFFLNNSEIFLEHPLPYDSAKAPIVNSSMIEDGVHPGPTGYAIWNSYLVPQITQILNDWG